MATIIENGTLAAFFSASHAWVLGNVVSYEPKSKTYTCAATDPEPIRQDKVKYDDIFLPRPENLEEDVNDLLMLTELHEASILFCLKRRYMRDVVYTNIGPIVVALNPFSYDIAWYKEDFMERYLSEGVVIERNMPHSWAVAHETYWEMRENSCNQTILISGESGAGKTEGAKIVVKYLAALSTRNGTVEQQQASRTVNKRVIAASPILEAFGNAKTIRNDNSSRFGKFMKIQFDRDGFLVGSFAVKYLLEKSRIISAAKDERLYHSYYQLACGADMKEYGIRGVTVHRMLLASGCANIPGVDDGVDFGLCKQAMIDVGIRPEEQRCIWSVVAGILFFQNIEFTEKEERSGMAAQLEETFRRALTRAAELWGVEERDMERELLTTTRMARGETLVGPLDKNKALDTRDSVSKGLYDWLFDWLVTKINTTTDAGAARVQLWIGLLDIFGFEDFTVNSFEQLCINLANESLQHHYNHHIFTEDIRECKEEGIDVGAFIPFADNKPCIDLLSNKANSVFALLDEECLVSGSEKNFMQKIVGTFQATKDKPGGGNPFFLAVTGKNKDNCFKIRHYAGDVTYTVDGFLDKNRDTLKDAMKLLLIKSTNALISSVTPQVEDSSRPTAKATVSGFFVRQLQELMVVIHSTNPHWIRCIKPHPAKKPRMFSHSMVTNQLRSAGVLDTVKVRQGGYPIRFTKDTFVMRYRVLLTKEDGATNAEICASVFRRLDITITMGQLGKSKVFLRHSAFFILNRAKDAATKHFAILFCGIARASKERSSLFGRYVIMHKARILAERRAKEEQVRLLREAELRRRAAEAEERARIERLEGARRREAATTIQRYIRGHLARRAVVRYFVEVMRAQEEIQNDMAAHAKCRQRCEDNDRLFRAYERRELEKQRSRHDRRKVMAEDTVVERPTTVVTTGRTAPKLAAVMARRREDIIVSRAKQQSDSKEALERAIKMDRDRRKAAEVEKGKLEKLQQTKVAEERRRVVKAQHDREDERMFERVQQEIANQAARERRAVLHAAKSDELLCRLREQQRMPSTARTTDDSEAFEAVKNDYANAAMWAAQRETVLTQCAATVVARQARLSQSLANVVAGRTPTMPYPALSAGHVALESFSPRQLYPLSPQQRRLEQEFQATALRVAEMDNSDS